MKSMIWAPGADPPPWVEIIMDPPLPVFFFCFKNECGIFSSQKNSPPFGRHFSWHNDANRCFPVCLSCHRRKKYEITLVFTISLQFLSNLWWIFWNHLPFFLRFCFFLHYKIPERKKKRWHRHREVALTRRNRNEAISVVAERFGDFGRDFYGYQIQLSLVAVDNEWAPRRSKMGGQSPPNSANFTQETS